MNKNQFNIISALIATLTLSSCSTISFVADKNANESYETSEWHHNIIYGLVEISNPVNVSQTCKNGFSAIRTERTFLNSLVGGIAGNIYNPMTVSMSCK